jgi:hypothetical protein
MDYCTLPKGGTHELLKKGYFATFPKGFSIQTFDKSLIFVKCIFINWSLLNVTFSLILYGHNGPELLGY